MQISAADPRRARQGFTLLELLIVIALLALGLAAVGNLMRRPDAGETVGNATRTALGMLRSARAQALGSGRPASVVIDTDGPALVAPWKHDTVALRGVDVSARVAREASSDGRPTILFFPDGTSTGGTLTIADGAAASRIEVHWLTGAINARD